MLTLKEELFIMLHYDAEKDALVDLDPSTSELIAFGGILVELILAGRVRLDENYLIVTDHSSLGDTILDDALAQMPPLQPINRNKPDWISLVAKRLAIGHRVFAGLLDRGILWQEEERILFGLSHSTFYPLALGIIPDLVEREYQVMVNKAMPDSYTAALLFMASVWDNACFGQLSGKDMETYQERWETLFGDYWGECPVDHDMEPVESLDAATRETIGCVVVSWILARTSYMAGDLRPWHQTEELAVI